MPIGRLQQNLWSWGYELLISIPTLTQALLSIWILCSDCNNSFPTSYTRRNHHIVHSISANRLICLLKIHKCQKFYRDFLNPSEIIAPNWWCRLWCRFKVSTYLHILSPNNFFYHDGWEYYYISIPCLKMQKDVRK